MEDILASIRRILNEDEAPPGNPAAAADAAPTHAAGAPTQPAAETAADGDDGVLVLDEAMLIAEPAAAPEPSPAFAAIPIMADPHPPPTQDDAPVPPADAAPDMPPASGAMPGGLMAPESTAAAAASVGSLLRTLSQERTTAVYRGGPTIEDLVREEVRPLLKEWLDHYLPPLVERLVRQEIERVAGRAAL